MKILRIDKYLADMGIGTRAQVKDMIRRGMVQVDGNTILDSGYKVTEEQEIVCNGEQVSYLAYEYYMLNKPAGVVTATTDVREKTVMDLIFSARKDLFPVGRLDKDTEGLLLITNDGMLAHQLLSPKKHVDKTYYVRLAHPVDAMYVPAFQAGLELSDGTKTLPARFESIDEYSAYLTIQEGKFHQVKRMFLALDNQVLYLKRISFGNLYLEDDLQVGQFRPLTSEEISGLYQHFPKGNALKH